VGVEEWVKRSSVSIPPPALPQRAASSALHKLLTRLDVLLEDALDRARAPAARHLDGVVVRWARGLASAEARAGRGDA
jgi:hypothetical protein